MYDDELHEKASAYASNRKDAYLEKMRKKEVEQQTNTQLNWLWVAHYEGYKEGYWTAKDESMLYTTPPPPKEPEQEPVAWMIWGKNNVPSLTFKNPSDKHVFDSLYTTPPQPTQVKLTDEEIEELANEYLFAEEDLGMLFVGGSVEFARAIEKRIRTQGDKNERTVTKRLMGQQ